MTNLGLTVADRIRTGALPSSLEGADWRRYRGPLTYADNMAGFARAWGAIAWLRLQAFERDAEAEAVTEDWEASA